MKAYASMIVFDSRDIRLSVAATKEQIREDLLEFYNDNADEWEMPRVDDTVPLEALIYLIENDAGYTVVVEETWVMAA